MGISIPFIKMHGAGNDFVVIDNRSGAFALDEDSIIALCDRRYGIGCDQVAVMEKSAIADVFMRIFNADGGTVASCGNATRCIGWLMMRELKREHVSIETKAGVLTADYAGELLVKVNMGRPRLDWREIPLIEEADTQNLPIIQGDLQDGFAVSMGNPHAVFFVENVDLVHLAHDGSVIEHHPFFPERTNVEIVQVISREHLKVRVWERGSGLTLACGTGACATVVAAQMRGLAGERVTVSLPGGDLLIEWRGASHDVWMTGPVAEVFNGEWKQA